MVLLFYKKVLESNKWGKQTLAGWTVVGRAGAAEMAGEGKTVVASTRVGRAVVAVTATGGVGYGKLVIGVLSGATEITTIEQEISAN